MNLNPENDKKGNILIVDDLVENLQLLGDVLLDLGYAVRSVTSGRMALKTVKVKRPDVILLDIKMPDMDGYTVCKAIKADESVCNIPIIFISALDDIFDKVAAFESGGADYITKPFQIEEVVARLDNQLTIQRQQRLLEEENQKRREAEAILEQARALLASVLNSSLDGIAALQAVRNVTTGEIEDFRFSIVNPVIARAFKCTCEEMIDQRLRKQLLFHLDLDLFDRFVEVVETGKPLEQDFCYSSGEPRWYHFVTVKLEDGFAITICDITIRKRMELALQDANHKLELLVNIDGLTQIANRRCFNDRLQFEWQRLAREQKPLSLILLDIDTFKHYNDSYGHLMGDDCLRKVGQAIHKQARRPADLATRYGGEEFAVLLPNTTLEGGITVAQNIQQAIYDLAIPHASNPKQIVTVSLGIATLIPTLDVDPNTLIDQADRALYKAKQQGRDRWNTLP